MKKKDSKNYLDFIPEKNPEIEYETGEDGIITVLIEWKGFYHKLAQRFFRRPRVSEIKLDSLELLCGTPSMIKRMYMQSPKSLKQSFLLWNSR